MKWVLISVGILVLVLVLIGMRLKSFYDKLGFDFKITKFTFTGLLRGQLGITMDLILDNKSSTSITVGDIYLEVYFKNTLIAITPVVVESKKIEKNKKTTIPGFEITTLINEATGEVGLLYYAKKPIQLEILTKLTFFGIPINFLPKVKYTYSDYTA